MQNDYKIISNVLTQFLSGKLTLTNTTNNGIALVIDSKKSVLVSFNLRDIIAEVPTNLKECLAMTFNDAIFIRHLLYLRAEMLRKIGKLSLPWKLLPEYYIQLINGKKFSLPSLLLKYSAAARRDKITLSSGLWKYMWYYKTCFNIDNKILQVYQPGDIRDMLRAQFIYDNKIYNKGDIIQVGGIKDAE